MVLDQGGSWFLFSIALICVCQCFFANSEIPLIPEFSHIDLRFNFSKQKHSLLRWPRAAVTNADMCSCTPFPNSKESVNNFSSFFHIFPFYLSKFLSTLSAWSFILPMSLTIFATYENMWCWTWKCTNVLPQRLACRSQHAKLSFTRKCLFHGRLESATFRWQNLVEKQSKNTCNRKGNLKTEPTLPFRVLYIKGNQP